MRPSPETRLRLLVTVVLALTPFVFFAIWGLVQKYEDSHERPGITREQMEEIRKLRREQERLAALGKRGDFAGVIAAVGDTCKSNDDCPPMMTLLRAEAQLRLGQRREAADGYGLLFRLDNISQADILAIRGEIEPYRSFCQNRLTVVQPENADANTANNTAWGCLLLPEVLTDYGPVVALAERAVATARQGEKETFLNTLGVALYRAGRYPEALAKLQESEKLKVEPFNWPFLAMVYERLGQQEKAKPWRAKLEKRMKESFGRGDPNQQELILFWQELQTLR